MDREAEGVPAGHASLGKQTLCQLSYSRSGGWGRSPAARIYHHSPVIGEAGVPKGEPETTIHPAVIPGLFRLLRNEVVRREIARCRASTPHRDRSGTASASHLAKAKEEPGREFARDLIGGTAEGGPRHCIARLDLG